jgi:ribosomal protein L17
MNISPFVRYSYYFRSLLPNSTNVDLGINFSIPLTLQTNKKRAVVDAERLIVDMEREQLEQKIIENIHTILLDIERLNRTSVSELNRLQELKQYLQVRSNAYNNRKGGYNIILRTKEYNTYLLCWEKFLSYQYQRDCLLMSLQTYLPNVSVFEFCVGEMVGG